MSERAPSAMSLNNKIKMYEGVDVITTHSRTALAESVVLNFVNVFTYSSVLL